MAKETSTFGSLTSTIKGVAATIETSSLVLNEIATNGLITTKMQSAETLIEFMKMTETEENKVYTHDEVRARRKQFLADARDDVYTR